MSPSHRGASSNSGVHVADFHPKQTYLRNTHHAPQNVYTWNVWRHKSVALGGLATELCSGWAFRCGGWGGYGTGLGGCAVARTPIIHHFYSGDEHYLCYISENSRCCTRAAQLVRSLRSAPPACSCHTHIVASTSGIQLHSRSIYTILPPISNMWAGMLTSQCLLTDPFASHSV